MSLFVKNEPELRVKYISQIVLHLNFLKHRPSSDSSCAVILSVWMIDWRVLKLNTKTDLQEEEKSYLSLGVFSHSLSFCWKKYNTRLALLVYVHRCCTEPAMYSLLNIEIQKGNISWKRRGKNSGKPHCTTWKRVTSLGPSTNTRFSVIDITKIRVIICPNWQAYGIVLLFKSSRQ